MDEMNELQKIVERSREKLIRYARKKKASILEWYTFGTSSISDIPFSPEEWEKEVSEITLEAILSSANEAMSGVYVLANVQQASGYFLDLKYDGVTLSESLRESAKYAEMQVVETMNRHLKHKTTWKRLSDDLTRQRVSKGDLPKYLTELREEAIATAGKSKRLLSMIAQAEQNIVKLAGEGAPTARLKKSYSKVIDAVLRGDSVNIDRAMKNALEQKAVYNNVRIVRTETARAHSMAFKRKLQDSIFYDSGRACVKITLSPSHPLPDICDHMASVNAYGLGAGVYPSNSAPMVPFHPNCLCSMSMVIVQQDANEIQERPEQSEIYLSSLSDKKRVDIERSMEQLDSNIKKLLPLPKNLVS